CLRAARATGDVAGAGLRSDRKGDACRRDPGDVLRKRRSAPQHDGRRVEGGTDRRTAGETRNAARHKAMNRTAPQFTIRAYGLLLHEGNVLVADQLIKGRRITKFPGGGLEYGEGLKDCLVREIREELDVRVVSIEHIYTTD